MAFNVGAFIKNTAKTAIDIISGDILDGVTTGLNKYSITTANSTAQSLIATGASYATAAAITAQTTDASVSKSDAYFYAMAGKDVTKASATDLANQRNQGAENVDYLLKNVVPSTKISAKKADKAETIMAVL